MKIELPNYLEAHSNAKRRKKLLPYAGISRQVKRSGLTFFNLFSSLATYVITIQFKCLLNRLHETREKVKHDHKFLHKKAGTLIIGKRRIHKADDSNSPPTQPVFYPASLKSPAYTAPAGCLALRHQACKYHHNLFVGAVPCFRKTTASASCEADFPP